MCKTGFGTGMSSPADTNAEETTFEHLFDIQTNKTIKVYKSVKLCEG